MRETKVKGEPGYTYRYITDENFQALIELQRQYEAMGKRTWLDKVDSCNPKWVLKIEEVCI